MSEAAAKLHGLAGAMRLAAGRGEAAGLVADDAATARFSFLAALVALPPYVALKLLAGGPLGADPMRVIAAEMIGYVAGWAALPVVLAGFVQGMGVAARFARFVTLWNWASLIQIMLLLAIAAVSEVLPAMLAQTLSLVSVGYILWLQWFVARHSLVVPGGRAAAIVGLDLMLGLFLSGLTATLAVG